jgi:heat shock protein HslJ
MRSILAAGLLVAIGAWGVAAADDPLVGKWRIERVRGAADVDAAKTAFEVAADGQVSSTVGCNRIVGKPSLTGDRLRFGPMAATRMACPPPLDRLETAYMAALDGRSLVSGRGGAAHACGRTRGRGRRARALRIRGGHHCGRSRPSNAVAALRRARHAASRGNWVWAMWL